MTDAASSTGTAVARARDWDDDTRLVKQCLEGKEAAWSELLSKYKNLVFSIPVKYGFSQEEAADIYQSVCLDLLNQLASLREPRALAGWLIRVTHNECFRHIRERRKLGPSPDDQPEATVPASEIPENMLHQLQQEQSLRSAVRSLGTRCQRLVEMLFFETPPRPYEQVAKTLDLATGSIGFIRGRCLSKLRRKLEELGFA